MSHAQMLHHLNFEQFLRPKTKKSPELIVIRYGRFLDVCLGWIRKDGYTFFYLGLSEILTVAHYNNI